MRVLTLGCRVSLLFSWLYALLSCLQWCQAPIISLPVSQLSAFSHLHTRRSQSLASHLPPPCLLRMLPYYRLMSLLGDSAPAGAVRWTFWSHGFSCNIPAWQKIIPVPHSSCDKQVLASFFEPSSIRKGENTGLGSSPAISSSIAHRDQLTPSPIDVRAGSYRATDGRDHCTTSGRW